MRNYAGGGVYTGRGRVCRQLISPRVSRNTILGSGDRSKSNPPSRMNDSSETDSDQVSSSVAADSSSSSAVGAVGPSPAIYQDYDACPLVDEDGYQAGIVRGSRLQYNDPSGLPLRR